MLSLISIITSTGIAVVGESYSVVCSIDLDDNFYNIVVNIIIVKIGEGVVNSSMNFGDNSVSISYTPLMTSHSGQYECVVNISQIDISYQVSYVKIFTINITSELYYTLIIILFFLIAIPSPIMNIMTTGIARPGEEYNITCTVEVIDRLIVTPTIIWIKECVNTSLVSDDLNTISVPSVLSNISDTMYSLSLFFSSLNTSDAGQYTCQAIITVNEINVTVINSSVQNLPLQSK